MGFLGGQAGGGGGIMSGSGGLNMSQIPFIGGMFPNPNEAAMQQAIQQSQNDLSAYRPQMAQAYQNLAGNQLASYQPAQGALMQMYGGSIPQGPTIANPSPGGMPPGQSSPQQPPSGGSSSSGDPLSGLMGGLPGLGGGGLPGLGGAGGLGGLMGGGGLPGFGGSSTGLPGPLGKVADASMNPFAGGDANHVAANILTGGLASLLGGK